MIMLRLSRKADNVGTNCVKQADEDPEARTEYASTCKKNEPEYIFYNK